MICSQFFNLCRAWQGELVTAPHGGSWDGAAMTRQSTSKMASFTARPVGASCPLEDRLRLLARDFVLHHMASPCGYVGSWRGHVEDNCSQHGSLRMDILHGSWLPPESC